MQYALSTPAALALAALAPMALAPMADAAPIPGGADAWRIDFTVQRNGAPIGSHAIAVRRDGRETTVEVAIDLEVKLAFVTVYRYRHRNTETWRDGRLVAIETTTEDNGTRHAVSGRATAEGFRVQSDAGTVTAPADIVPTSYWNPETVRRTRLLDTQRGRILEVAVTPAAAAGMTSRDPGRRYRMTGDLALDLWYGPGGVLAKLAFELKGDRFEYLARAAQDGPTRSAGRRGVDPR